MTGRRPLGELLIELLEMTSPLGRDAALLRLSSVVITLPIDVALQRVDGAWEFLGDVPRTVTRTAFDGRPGRIEVLYVAGIQA